MEDPAVLVLYLDTEPEPAATKEPEETESTIALEPEPNKESDQVCGPATTPVPVGILVGYKGSEEGPAHITTTEGELQLAFVDLLSPFDPLFSLPGTVSLSSSLVLAL